MDSGHAEISVVAAPLRKQVSALLRRAVVSGEVPPGERLVEGDLSARYGVSRTVVREALRHLEAEGLVQVIANRGAIVRRMTLKDALDLFEVRMSLEPVAAGYAAERASAGQRGAMDDAFRQLAAAYEAGELPEMLAAKERFYQSMMAASGNDALAALGKIIHGRGQMLCGRTLRAPGRAEESLAELKRVVDHVIAGEVVDARAASLHHIESARAIWQRLSEEDSS